MATTSRHVDDLVHITESLCLSGGVLTRRPTSATPDIFNLYFPYKTLDATRRQIRLLKIHGNGSAYGAAQELRCQLVHASLNDNLDFSALSYAWGDASTRPYSVLINWKQFNVTSNLYAALRMLQRQAGSGLYWIDAICINQNDSQEQNSQISLMGQIYLNAQTVHVWLGEAHADTELVEPFVRRFTRAYQNQHEAKDATLFPRLSDRARARYGYPIRSDPGYAALESFLLSPWCSRVWIVQEIALAKAYTLHRGTCSISPGAIVTVVASHINPEFNHPNVSFQRCVGDLMLVSLENTRIKDHHATRLLALLLRHRTTQASKPRDKVYGLLGIASDVVSGHVSIPVDVAKSYQTVYTDTARAIILADKSLNILSTVDSAQLPHPDGLPSWVPDWRACDDHGKSDTHVFRDEEPGFEHVAYFKGDATSGSSALPRFCGMRMTVRVLFLDRISVVGAILTRDQPLPPYPDWEWKADARSKQPYVHTGEPMLEVFYHTVTMGTCADEPSRVRKMQERYDRKWRPLRKLLDRHISSTGLEVAMSEDGHRDQLIRECRSDPYFAYISCALNRCLVKTRHGRLVMAPALADTDDWVVLCEGARMPMVLRPHGEEWRLVGDCYVREAMLGQLWADDSELKEIVLV